jgi:hypothetical protein
MKSSYDSAAHGWRADLRFAKRRIRLTALVVTLAGANPSELTRPSPPTSSDLFAVSRTAAMPLTELSRNFLGQL